MSFLSTTAEKGSPEFVHLHSVNIWKALERWNEEQVEVEKTEQTAHFTQRWVVEMAPSQPHTKVAHLLSTEPNLTVQYIKPKNVSFVVFMMLTHRQAIPLLEESIFTA